MSMNQTAPAHTLDPKRWARLCEQLGAANSQTTFARIEAAYRDPPRGYHNAKHIADCLNQLDAFVGASAGTLESSSLYEIEAALWFHDAIYDSRAKDNEEQSVRFMEREFLAAQVPSAVVERIGKLIMATAHQSPPENGEAALITDIDLSILGSKPGDFEAFDLAIRDEYCWVPLEDYRKGRAKVLRLFLERKPHYRVPYFQERYESQAKANLERKIAELEH